MKDIRTYFDPNSVEIMEDFFQSDNCTSGFNFDMYIGALTSNLCCSSHCDEFEYGEIIVGNKGQAYQELTDYDNPTPFRLANVSISNDLGDLLYDKQINFVKSYPHAENSESPSQNFTDWCIGFTKMQQLTESHWYDDFDLLAEIPDFDKADDMIGECQSLFMLADLLADFEKALSEHEDPQKLKLGLYQAYGAVAEGVYTLHTLGMMLEELKLELAEFNPAPFAPAVEVETFVREHDKVGRNDPCPCGSGKKYKKCCGK
nr:SEC-C metal-binding domain-containing protein [Saccharobesus litoralis]